jgi:2-dehydro-3-deoxy-D-gluconate 5-dehydrogenase
MGILDAFSLAGSRAIVTGGGGGIGSAMAAALSEAGARVALIGRTESVNEVAARLSSSSAVAGEKGSAIAIVGDLSRPDELERAFRDAVTALDGLDILIPAHGTSEGRGPSLAVSREDWQMVLEVNLISVFSLCRLAGEIMTHQRSGKIVTIASMLSFFGGYNAAAYAASKGGIVQLTKSLANEWAPFNVNVNAIAPGFVRTQLTRHVWSDPERNERLVSRIPAGRWGEPDDLRGAAVFLCSSASDYVHGAVIPVDGGHLSRSA